MTETQLKDYLDIPSTVENSRFTKNQLRWLVVKRKENGLDGAIKRVGRKLYFHIPTFLKWVEEQKG